jgi:hypothetical protein
MLPNYLLPIKVVIPREKIDYKHDAIQGGGKKQFCEITPALRSQFISSLHFPKKCRGYLIFHTKNTATFMP